MTDNNNYHELWNPPPRESGSRGRRQNAQAEGDNVIGQVELRELVRLQRQRDQYKQLWSSIRQRLLNGAAVEPGLRHVRIEELAVVSFSQAAFEQLFGADWVAEQRSRIEPSIQRRMVLEDQGPLDPLGE
jgi:hypothetical protein